MQQTTQELKTTLAIDNDPMRDIASEVEDLYRQLTDSGGNDSIVQENKEAIHSAFLQILQRELSHIRTYPEYSQLLAVLARQGNGDWIAQLSQKPSISIHWRGGYDSFEGTTVQLHFLAVRTADEVKGLADKISALFWYYVAKQLAHYLEYRAIPEEIDRDVSAFRLTNSAQKMMCINDVLWYDFLQPVFDAAGVGSWCGEVSWDGTVYIDSKYVSVEGNACWHQYDPISTPNSFYGFAVNRL